MAKATKTYNDHILVPEHEKLSDKQKQDLLKEYNCTVEELPRIMLTDISIKELSVKVGDVIKIQRTSRTEGKGVFYRVVVNE